jgi:hypothetical protein
MGALLIKCPVTGREFSTGLQISATDVPMLPDALSQARCPHCTRNHKWRPSEARYADALPPRDWIEKSALGLGDTENHPCLRNSSGLFETPQTSARQWTAP